MSPERRKELGRLLKAIPGVKKVYFQPPENVKLEYPCIIYVRDDVETLFASNLPYLQTKRYLVTIIDQDPDSVIPDTVAALPLSGFIRRFETQGLNHDIYSLYF
jgi:hypothetical protein